MTYIINANNYYNSKHKKFLNPRILQLLYAYKKPFVTVYSIVFFHIYLGKYAEFIFIVV